jgi:prenylcysteine oxidase/farnesylcysteine lyase
MRSISVLLALAGPVLAEIWLPVNGGDTHQAVFLADRVPAATPITRVPRVAIIGAGPGGSSAAFFLAQLAERNSSLTTDVTLFERSDYIGGRSTTVPVPSADEDDVYAELGATIFVKANRNLWKAAGRFNLTLQEGHGGGSTEEKGGVAVYDGETFVYHEAVGSSYYWNLAKLLWK